MEIYIQKICEKSTKKSKNLVIIAEQQKIIKAGFTRIIDTSYKARLLLIYKKTPESGSAAWIRKRIHELLSWA